MYNLVYNCMQESHQTYGHIRCIYTVPANPDHEPISSLSSGNYSTAISKTYICSCGIDRGEIMSSLCSSWS